MNAAHPATRRPMPKEALTLQALAAMKGYRVDPIEADDGSTAYCVTRWALTRQCSTLDQLREVLDRMGVKE